MKEACIFSPNYTHYTAAASNVKQEITTRLLPAFHHPSITLPSPSINSLKHLLQMADALTITASSLVGIIEVLSKTTSRLGELKQQWKHADFVFINLIAQLSALKAALKKLQEWIDTDTNEAHQLLFMDLEGSITCCRMLIDEIESKISDLHQDTKNGLSSQAKMKLIIKNGTLEELQKMVARQINALTLLLTACNW